MLYLTFLDSLTKYFMIYLGVWPDQQLWAVLSKTLSVLNERFEDDKLIIERIIILIRNILQVKNPLK